MAKEIIARRFSGFGLPGSGIAQEAGKSDLRLSVEFKKAYHTPLELYYKRPSSTA